VEGSGDRLHRHLHRLHLHRPWAPSPSPCVSSPL
jgi:hypothetical protein